MSVRQVWKRKTSTPKSSPSSQKDPPPLPPRVYLQSPSSPSYNPLRDQMINQLHNISTILYSHTNPSNAYIHAPPSLSSPQQIHPLSHAQIGHTVDRCFELVGYPAGYVKKNFNANTRHVSSNNATRSNSHVSLSNEQLARLMILLNDNVFQLLMPISQIVDSGANQHMAVSAKFLINVVDISNLCLTVGHLNGTQALITKIGFKGKQDCGDWLRAYAVIFLRWIYDGNDNSEATSIEENNTHLEGNVSDETDFVGDFYENLEFNSKVEDLPVNTIRRSSRQTKLPTSLNDIIIDGKVKYGVEIVVNYANLSHENSCFTSSLNKSIEPTCYNDVILDNNWIDAMNAEIKALKIILGL
ncbi:hypothetical protein Tco_1363207 [Tanacetum coccineum]